MLSCFQGSDPMEPSRWTHWDMQSGYHQPAGSYGHVHNLQTHPEKPIRAVAPGLHQGLTVMMDVKEDEYFCTGTESVGFKVLNINMMVPSGFSGITLINNDGLDVRSVRRV